MPLLLNIDTATEIASICLSVDGVPLVIKKNEQQKEHASFVHTAIASVLDGTGYQLKNIDAFVVTSGPGSYTGLRVGMATAKGFCYALSKPLIAINTLEVMTKAALGSGEKFEEDILFCPMIDARRMEVFTAVYNSNLETVLSPRPLVLQEDSFCGYLEKNKMIFFGSGSNKFRQFEPGGNALFSNIKYDASHLGMLGAVAFVEKKFSDLSYSEPTYFKEFHSIAK